MNSHEIQRIVLASCNKGKLIELVDLLQPFDVKFHYASEWPGEEPEETGGTFEENAFIKASYWASISGLPALSDDSGLCIDALAGQPGVRTAEFAIGVAGKPDFNLAMQRIEESLRETDAVLPEERQAKFVSVVCIAFPDGKVDFFSGEVAGTLVWPPRGKFGFGYDPVFMPEGYDQTFAEMPQELKNKSKQNEAPLSHRARAFSLFANVYLQKKPVIEL